MNFLFALDSEIFFEKNSDLSFLDVEIFLKLARTNLKKHTPLYERLKDFSAWKKNTKIQRNLFQKQKTGKRPDSAVSD